MKEEVRKVEQHLDLSLAVFPARSTSLITLPKFYKERQFQYRESRAGHESSGTWLHIHKIQSYKNYGRLDGRFLARPTALQGLQKNQTPAREHVGTFERIVMHLHLLLMKFRFKMLAPLTGSIMERTVTIIAVVFWQRHGRKPR